MTQKVSSTMLASSGTLPAWDGSALTNLDVDKLDDYEKGFFTPAITATTNDHTYTLQVGWYVKIGVLVNYGGRLVINSIGSTSGNASLTGLPYSNTGTSNAWGGFTCGRGNNLAITANSHIAGFINQSSAIVTLRTWNSTIGGANTTFSEIGGVGGDLSFFGTYFAG